MRSDIIRVFALISTLTLLCAPDSALSQKVVRYDLYISDTTVNYTGESVAAIAINGKIGGPTLTFTEGDTAMIYVHNLMNVETSLHSHGVILPVTEDGVPYLTTAPTLPHTTHLYTFPIVQHGTFFYHSHTGFQEQLGLYGAYVFLKRPTDSTRRWQDSIPSYTMLLGDWTNESPREVMRSLHMANDWYSIEKHSTQNWGEALISGYFGEKVNQEWLRMSPMDISDVYYDAFLTNGETTQRLPQLHAGDKIRLRIINASASTYFWLQYAGGNISVIASDGADDEPVQVNRLIIGISEIYDVVVTIPENHSYEFKATAEDRSGSTSVWLGAGMKMRAPILPKLKLFEGMKMMNGMMHLDGSMDNMGMAMHDQTMDMNSVMYPEITEGQPANVSSAPEQNETSRMDGMNMGGASDELVTLNYAMLRSTLKTTMPDAPTKVLHLNLTGNMNRYQWSINNVALSSADQILIRRGENVRIILDNKSMMRHPMHLHGQYFRVLNGMGDYSPLKNVIDIMPMEIDTIEFPARYDGDWFFHCHILYHMMSGMGRVFRVNQRGNIEPIANPQIDTIAHAWDRFINDDNMWAFSTFIGVQSQELSLRVILMNRDFMFDGNAMVNFKGSFESETHFARFIGQSQFLKLFVGTDIRHVSLADMGDKHIIDLLDNRTVATTGIQYLLPLFIQSELRIDHTGKFRFQVAKYDMALTSRLRLDALWNTDKEYEVGLRYIVMKRWSLSTSIDSHFGLGAGIMFTY